MEDGSAEFEPWMWRPFETRTGWGQSRVSLAEDGSYRITVDLRPGIGARVATVDVLGGVLRVLDDRGLLLYGAAISAEVDVATLRASLEGDCLVLGGHAVSPLRRTLPLERAGDPKSSKQPASVA